MVVGKDTFLMNRAFEGSDDVRSEYDEVGAYTGVGIHQDTDLHVFAKKKLLTNRGQHLEVGLMGKMNVSNNALLALFAEMVWDNAIRKYKEENLYKEIDRALAKGDQTTFLALTSELKTLQSLG
ncbi:IDEAL domain-containing protein [Paenibacillus sp. yr247]|nr:IDEAL domain-containing protein [Paenibacillus sp. yr247]